MEPQILKIIADNPTLIVAVRKTLEDELKDTPEDMGFSNERLGERVRARMTAMEAIEKAFKKIATYQTVQPKEPMINKAR